MRIIPVLDLKGGQAVHAVAGVRSAYRPLVSRFHPTPDPVALAWGMRDQAGTTEVYLADLDAIVTRAEPAWATFRALADLGLTVWADVGIMDGTEARRLLDAGVGQAVAGLETVGGPDVLAGLVGEVGADRVVWSLDLRDGVPVLPRNHSWAGDSRDPASLTGQAVGAGVRQVLRLDLATVGTGRGVAGIPPIPPGWPGVTWITGGGVTGAADLAALGERGYAAVLVGSAWHDGRIGGMEAVSGHPY